jgi:DNA invertase Pin-like site-specific DNA recombinase
MTATILARAEALLRELLPTMPTKIKRRAELFLARQGGRPRTVDRELCRRLRAEGVSAAEIAIRIGCDQSTVFRALKTKEE